MIQPIAGICKALAASLVIVGTISSFSQPSLPASFQARTIHSPAGAEISCASAAAGRWFCCCMGTLRTAIHGHRLRPT
jgi:hypothetical protein